MHVHFTKLGLSVVEAGWLLQRPEARIRGMLRRGELSYVVAGRLIDPASVRAWLTDAYARLLLDVVLAGGFVVPRPERRWGAPAPLHPGVLGLALQIGFVVPEDESRGWMKLARILGPELLRDPAALRASERSVR